jgi:predicted Zn-dependent peptidase
VLRELGDVSKDGAITPAELEQARASLTRGYVRHFETAAQLARAMVQLVAYDLDADTFDRFVPAVNGLPLEALTRAARATLHPADSAIVVVGDLEQHGQSLESLGREVTETRPEF